MVISGGGGGGVTVKRGEKLEISVKMEGKWRSANEKSRPSGLHHVHHGGFTITESMIIFFQSFV